LLIVRFEREHPNNYWGRRAVGDYGAPRASHDHFRTTTRWEEGSWLLHRFERSETGQESQARPPEEGVIKEMMGDSDYFIAVGLSQYRNAVASGSCVHEIHRNDPTLPRYGTDWPTMVESAVDIGPSLKHSGPKEYLIESVLRERVFFTCAVDGI
jgi:hypothetical protein